MRLGKKKISAIIDHEMSYIEAVEQWFTENIVRRELTTYDKAKILKKMHDIGVGLNELTKRFCITPNYARMLLKFIEKGSPRIHKQIEKGKRLPMYQALRIVDSFDNFSDQEAIARALAKLGIRSQKAIKTVIDKAKQMKHAETKISTEKLIKALHSIKSGLKNTTDKYYATFNQNEILQKAYTKLTKNRDFKKLASKHQLALL